MSVAELQKYTAVSKYARWLEEEKKRETWLQTTHRSRQMMLDSFPQAATDINNAYDFLDRREVLGSQRALQYAGRPILQHNARLYNCTGSYCDRLRFFGEAFYLLLCGAGVGFSVQDRHLSRLPNFSRKRRQGVTLPRKVFRPTDTIEGWADTTMALLSSYHETPIKGFEEYHDCELEFDLSLIRRKGAKLSFGIGKAPGPKPLNKAIERKRQLLNTLLGMGLDRLRSVDAFDLVMHDSDAVLAGGVRRSATICIFDLWDALMAQSKTGDWFSTNPQRARANISAMLLRDKTSFDEFYKLFEHTRQWGEPGFYWSDHPDCLPNPCVEIGFWCRLALDADDPKLGNILDEYDGPVSYEKGKTLLSGWQFCNLSTINGKTVKSEQDFYKRCEAASVIGTCQAAFTSFPYLGQVTERIVEREALLGVSIGGVMHHPELLLKPEVLREGVRRGLAVNERLAKVLGINPCARWGCIKPDGNSASLLGAFSGGHAGKMRRGFRIVQANRLEAPYQFFQSVNPEACEASKWSANHTDDVIRFCVEYDGVLEEDQTAIQALENVRILYMNWVMPGKVEKRCTQPWLSNNVSNTVRVRDHEWKDVAAHIYFHRDCYAGISLIGWHGDRDYTQAPFTAVFTEDEITRMYPAEAVVDANDLLRASCVFGDLWDACGTAMGNKHANLTHEHMKWIADFTAYADQHFHGNLRPASYCLKDVWNNLLYRRLQRCYRPVDYSLMVEEENTSVADGEMACAGGACLV